MADYKFDFFETLTSINFPTGGYARLDLSAFSPIVFGGAVPPAPAASFQLDADKLVSRLDRTRTVVTPARTVTTTIYFAWSSIAPLPTLDNWNTEVFHSPPDPPVEYHQQFSQIVDVGFGFTDPFLVGTWPDPKPSRGSNGTFSTRAEAQHYVDVANAVYATPPPIAFESYLNTDGLPVGPFAYTGYFVGSLDFVQHIPAQAQTFLDGTYLLKVPRDDTTALMAVSGVGGDGGSFVQGRAYSRQGTITSVSQLKGPPDSTSSATALDGRYVISTRVPKKAQIVISGGHGGTGGTG